MSKKAEMAPPEMPAGEKKPFEQWGYEKGFTPWQELRRDQHGALQVPPVKTHPNFWKLAAARMYCGWADGAEVTEAEFDKAITDATSVRIG